MLRRLALNFLMILIEVENVKWLEFKEFIQEKIWYDIQMNQLYASSLKKMFFFGYHLKTWPIRDEKKNTFVFTIWRKKVLLTDISLSIHGRIKYFFGIFRNSIKIHYKKCFTQSRKIEILLFF